jgi:predicted peroxiredoxin
MTTLFYFGTHGFENPTKATMPFHLANGAREAGFTAQIALGGEAAMVIKDGIAAEIHGVGIPPLAGLIATLAAHDVPIYV